ncbi:glycine cleavage system protein GcvH [Clostridium ganghwense]|uniref:Glycine cleavage system H protein n=1 Tax=Clostridium ganghwense TaxID=312089 RepID=A0ABT4CRF9_9CLOT|nr:glycine cleavage system protein GcvH [Clostridium ganghwense]MCY6371023.1 glycine cleavage system protein GcvH [Clostridium ganghwense]
MKVLKNLYYTEDHEWIKVDGHEAYIGITDYAQQALGDIVYVDLPEEETEFTAGDTLGVVESVKAASDIYIPVDGKVLEINEDIVDEPELVNNNAYKNWMVKVELYDESQIDELMNAEEYKEFSSREE